MKTLLLTLSLVIISPTLFSQSITIGEDGIVRCKDVAIGTTETIFGETYEVVDRALLEQRRDEGADLTKSCVSNIRYMNDLFEGKIFNQPIRNWDVSNVGNMNSMFESSTFNQPIGNWDVSSVGDMAGMFFKSGFNQPIGNWDVGSVRYMESMFQKSNFNQAIGNWDVSSVTDMSGMFYFTLFNQPINNWCVHLIRNEPEFFSDDSPLKRKNKPKWGTCPSN